MEFLVCGETNMDYLLESNQKKHLSSLLTTYNLSHTVNFATRMQNESSTAIDNIFVDNSMLYPGRSRWERIMDVVPRGTELEDQLRRGVGQASHTCNNIHIKRTGVY
jgi:hypothetical protein